MNEQREDVFAAAWSFLSAEQRRASRLAAEIGNNSQLTR